MNSTSTDRMRVHFDVNGTVIITDKASKKTYADVLQSAFASCTEACWEKGAERMTFYNHHKALPYKERTDLMTNFITNLEEWEVDPDTHQKHPDLGEIKRQYEQAIEAMNEQYFVPAFVHFVKRCEEEGRRVQIVFRSFGNDIPEVVEQFHRIFPQREKPTIGKFEKQALSVGGNKVAEGARNVHEFMLNFKGDLAIVDDYHYWNDSGRKREFSKLFPSAPNTFFFDDCFNNDKEDDIIYAVDAVTENSVFPVSNALRADLIQAILDPDYFYKNLFEQKT